jgi:hypothetical protein
MLLLIQGLFHSFSLEGVRGWCSGEYKRKPSLFVVSWEKDADCRAIFLPEVAVE